MYVLERAPTKSFKTNTENHLLCWELNARACACSTHHLYELYIHKYGNFLFQVCVYSVCIVNMYSTIPGSFWRVVNFNPNGRMCVGTFYPVSHFMYVFEELVLVGSVYWQKMTTSFHHNKTTPQEERLSEIKLYLLDVPVQAFLVSFVLVIFYSNST